MAVAVALLERAYLTIVAARLTVPSRKPAEDSIAVIIALLARDVVALPSYAFSEGFSSVANTCLIGPRLFHPPALAGWRRGHSGAN
jgi:hypothetical protein